MRIPRWLGLLALALIGFFWGLAVVYPIISVLVRARDLSLLLDPSILFILRTTASQAWISTLISALLGLPLGLWAGSRMRPAHVWAQRLLAVPSAVPSVVASFAWISLLGRSGLLAQLGIRLDWVYSLHAVILAHVFFNVPWIALLVAQARSRVPERELEAARTLGAGSWTLFRSILFPRVKFAFFSAATQALTFCAMSFALVMILGGGPPVETLETALYSRIRFGELDLSGAVACGIWELVLTLPPWALVLYWRSREEALFAPGSASAKPVGRLSAVALVALSAFFVIPYFVIFVGIVFPTGNSADISAALAVSARLALCTGFAATFAAALAVLALLALRRSWRGLATALLLLPGGISAMVLGLGLWLAYGRFIDPFEGSFFAMVFLQVALFFPISFRILWPLAREFPRRQFESALTMGASPWVAFRLIDWPRWKGPVVAAFAIVAAASLGEVAAVSLFYSENLIPLPLLISRWMSQYRFEDAQAVVALLFFLSAFTIILISMLSSRNGSLRGANQRPI